MLFNIRSFAPSCLGLKHNLEGPHALVTQSKASSADGGIIGNDFNMASAVSRRMLSYTDNSSRIQRSSFSLESPLFRSRPATSVTRLISPRTAAETESGSAITTVVTIVVFARGVWKTHRM